MAKNVPTAASQKQVAKVKLDASMFEQDAGAGADNVTARDLAIPFLVILQSMSPQVDKKKPEFIKGAEPGFVLNTVTGEMHKEPVELTVVPCYYEQKLIEWQPRESGGGLVAIYDITDPIAQKAKRDPATNRDVLPNNNLLVTTSQHYVLQVKDDGSFEPAVISMTSTQLKHSKRWNSMMANVKMKSPDGRVFTPAVFSHQYKVKVKGETNNKGSWHGWDLELDKQVSDPELYMAAKQFYQAVSQGRVKATPPAAAAEHGSDAANQTAF